MGTLTIVVCTFNAAAHLPGCLSAIRGQRARGVEVILMDGGSTDGTLDVIVQNADIVDVWQSKADNGVYDAMNSALNSVQSEWVLFLGADDRLMPGVLPRLLDLLKGFDPNNSVLYGDVYRPRTNALYDGKFTKYKILRRNICQQAIIYPTQKLKEAGFDLSFKINADHIKNIHLFFDKAMTMHYIPLCIAHYEDMADGISRNSGDRGILSARRRLAWKLGGAGPLLFCLALDFKTGMRQASKALIQKLFPAKEHRRENAPF